MNSVSKFLLESITGLWMSAGCLLSGGPHPCKPCALCSFRWGSHQLPFPVFPHHPSWTCGGEKSPVFCGVVKSERLRGCSSSGSWWQSPCHPSWVALEEALWPLLPPPLLGLPSGTPETFLEGNLRHTFLWVCSTEEEMNACFRHHPQL